MKAFRTALTERNIKVVFLGVFALSLAFQLFIPPTIGLADNGDFGKIAGWFNRCPVLSAPAFMNGAYGYFSPKYTIDVHSALWPHMNDNEWQRYIRSPHYSVQYGWRSDEDFVEVLYRTAWFLPPTEADKQYWLGILRRHEKSREDLLRDFVNNPNWQGGVWTSKAQRLVSSIPLLVAPAFIASSYFSKDGIADVRFVGFLYWAILVSALSWALLAFRGLSAASWAIVLTAAWFVFSDVALVSQLNSLLIDPAANICLFVALLSIIRMAVTGETRAGWVVALAGLFFFTTSKFQHLLPGLCIAMLLALFAVRTASAYRRWIAGGCAAALLGSLILVLLTPPSYRLYPLHHSIFLNIVPFSSDPAGSLRELGLPAEYVRYSGITGYQDGTPMLQAEYKRTISRVNQTSLAWFYLRHPGIIEKVFLRDLGGESVHRLFYLGNFEQSTGYPVMSQSHSFNGWSALKTALLRHHPLRYAALYIGSMMMVWLSLRRARPKTPALLWLAAAAVAVCAGLEFVIATLADGLDNGRHLFIVAQLGDLCFVGMLYGILFHVESMFHRPGVQRTHVAVQPSSVRLKHSSAHG